MNAKSKKLIICTLIIVICIGAFSMLTYAEADDPAITVSIEKFNLSFKDTIYIKYAVLVEGVEESELTPDNFKMLFWTSPAESYEIGTETTSAASTTYQDIQGIRHYVFSYTNLVAKNMTDNVYARAYLKIGETVYYSDVEKYSVLQYAYTQLGKCDTAPSSNENLKQLLSDMLVYGASAQTYLSYQTNRLATAPFYYITLENGYLEEDLTAHGLFLEGETATICAAEQNSDGQYFSKWVNSKGETVSTERTYTLCVGAQNETYTAEYEAPQESYDYLTFTLKGDGTYYSVKATDGVLLPSKVVIPATYNGLRVMEIEGRGFYDRKEITSFVLSENVTTIGSDAFGECRKLVEIYDLSPYIEVVRGSGAGYGNLGYHAAYVHTSIDTPSEIQTTSDGYEFITKNQINYLLGYSGNETVLSLPASHNGETYQIHSYAFVNDTSITEVIVPPSVTVIESRAFYNAGALTSVTLSEGLTLISSSAFGGTAITEISIPAGVETIGDRAFANCKSLKSVTLNRGIKTIDEWAFLNCSGIHLYITDLESWLSALTYNEASNPHVKEGAIHFLDNHGNEITDIVIPDSATYIGRYKFYNANITSVTMSDNVKSIGQYAFTNCKYLRSIALSKNLETIENAAFNGCIRLQQFTVPASLNYVKNGAFPPTQIYITDLEAWLNIQFQSEYACHEGQKHFLDANGNELTELAIPSTVTKIYAKAFYNSPSITKIVLPDTVTEIGAFTFYSCANLTQVFYTGDAATKESLMLNTSTNGNQTFISATWYFYSETAPTEEGYYWHYVDGVPTPWGEN